MVCLGFVGCPHRTVGAYFVTALLVLCVIISIRMLCYVIAVVCCGRDREPTEMIERDIREIREVRERASTEAMQFLFRLSPPWVRYQEPEIPNAAPVVTECDSKLVISAGCDHVSCIARPCPLKLPSEEPK